MILRDVLPLFKELRYIVNTEKLRILGTGASSANSYGLRIGAALSKVRNVVLGHPLAGIDFTVAGQGVIRASRIEHHKASTDEEAKKNQGWLFGCDICIDVCPFNSRPVETPWEEFRYSRINETIPLDPILAISDDVSFRERFQGTPLTRPGLEGLRRNAGIVYENLNRDRQDGRREKSAGRT